MCDEIRDILYNQQRRSGKAILRDDQMCLLVWSAKIIGLEIPDYLARFLSYKQECHGLARWLTTATGYLRIYGSVCGTQKLNDKSMQDLRNICNFVISVYTPAWFKIFYHPSATDGPQIMLDIRDYMLNASEFYQFPLTITERLKKIFLPHGLSWLSGDNVALAVLSDNNVLSIENVMSTDSSLIRAERESMLWETKYKLENFLCVETKLAPCLQNYEHKIEFWKATMNNNRSCERYIGRIKEIIENKKLKEDDEIDNRIQSIINLQDIV